MTTTDVDKTFSRPRSALPSKILYDAGPSYYLQTEVDENCSLWIKQAKETLKKFHALLATSGKLLDGDQKNKGSL